ncbi:sulfurtransferase complex subunit TusD [Alteromonas sp. CYL-A6]|uniref:sulfurtransferase complex subunit TusD n=1 Tax=Alteromonas nitratireducens TaxID=3390813 RepID=UPI0034A6A0B3
MTCYSLLVTTAPFDSDAAKRAHDFVVQSHHAGHKVDHIFFYGEGIYHANALSSPPTDEYHPREAWQALHETLGVRLIVCVTAATKRGVISPQEASEAGIVMSNLSAPFEQAGLGEFFTALHHCDHLVQF